MKLTTFIIFILLIISLFSVVSIYHVTLSGNVVMINNVPFFQVRTATAGSGAGVIVPPAFGPLPPGTVLTLKAIANPGSFFVGWSKQCLGPPGSDTCILPVQTDTMVVAIFDIGKFEKQSEISQTPHKSALNIKAKEDYSKPSIKIMKPAIPPMQNKKRIAKVVSLKTRS